MRRPPWDDRRESGASTLEYAAVIAVAAILIVAVLGAARQANVGPILSNAVCRVAVALGVIPCAEPSGDDGGGDLDPDDVDVPDGLDRNSDLVQTLLSTERGRQTLQWLADNHIPIVIDPDEEGAFWNGRRIVLGEGYDNAAVVVHEANHARYTVEGRHADPKKLDRAAYVSAAIAEEADGTVQQILAAKEFRAGGRDLGRQPAEDAYDAAYVQAIQNGETLGEAKRAAAAAVRREFDSGVLRTSNSGQSYPDYYGHYWDKVN
jgi:hypothetical protein